MDASVIICTRNRAISLSRTLASIEAARRPTGFAWELLVVDNGSTDGTDSIIAEFGSRLPLTSVKEPKPGLSHARNRGVTIARGRYLIWTDDDVIVEREWLCAYADAFLRWPEAAAFGGKIRPVLEEPICSWFAACREELDYLLAGRDFGDDTLGLSIDEDRLPFGANYVVRAAEQRLFPYDPELGVAPGRNRMGEESQVLRAVLDSGATGYYVPGSVVRHMIPPSRQTIAYVRAYYRAHGETASMQELPQNGRRFVGLPIWLWRQIGHETVAYGLGRMFSSPPVWVSHLKKLSYWQGYAKILRARSRKKTNFQT